MRGPETEPAVERGDRFAIHRVAPVELLRGATLGGLLLAGMAGAVPETLFLAATFIALFALTRLELPAAFEFSLAIGILLQGWGNAILLFERIGWYDKVVHFLTPLLVVPSLYLLLARAGAAPSLWGSGLRRATIGVLVFTTALGTALAAVWELVEGTADRWLGTSLAHGYFETIDDLYSSFLGSVAAGVFLAWLVTTGGRDLTLAPVSADAVAENE